MDRENFADDDERLRALVNDISSASESGTLTINQSYISNQQVDDDSEVEDVPTTNEDVNDDDIDIPSEPELVTAKHMFEPHSNSNVVSYVPPSPIRLNEPPKYEPL